ncbi:MAG: protein kinase domain-containing protein [Pyrinomonadaceae bacterium]
MSLSPGTQLGRYEIRSPLGAGGMGEVYLAEDTKLRRPIAIKILTGDYTQNEERLRRFEREAYAASSLNHPNIVTIYEIGSEAGLHFIATEYVEGVSLRQHIRSDHMELREAVEIAIQITSALAAAHQRGIIHRDIKPENIMLRRDGYVKVLDFGLAKLAFEVDRAMTDTEASTEMFLKTEPGRVMGTVNYMSPEQIRGHEVDARTDIFSLGVILYEMLSGRRPFSGPTKSDVLAAVLMVPSDSLVKHFPDVPPELDRIVAKTLRKDRDERYQSAKELLVDLKSLKQELEFEVKMGRPAVLLPGGDRETVTTDRSARKVGTYRQSDAGPTISELFINEVKSHPQRATLTLSIIALLIGIGGVGLYRLIRLTQRPESFQAMRLTKMTFAGNVVAADVAVSPDGKYVVYAVQEGQQQSLWVKQVATSSNVQIVSPTAVTYYGLTFSLDGNYVYYSIVERGGLPVLYRVPALGGPGRRLIENAYAPVSLSPDAGRLAFVRGDRTELKIANADGTEVRTLATREGGERWLLPTWSPDGQIIACGVYSPAGNQTHLVEVAVKDGTEKRVGSQPWLSIHAMAWLTDGSGLLLAARDLDTRLSQVWMCSYPEGKVRRVTNDLSAYTGASLTADGKTLASVQGERLSNLWVVPGGDASLARRITFDVGKDEGLEGLSWTPDGSIVYSSRAMGTWDLWIVNQDGSNSRQLTFSAGNNNFPSVSPDGRYIVFVSDRSGISNIWRIDLDGGNLKQLTNNPGLTGQPNCSSDSKWVVYQVVGNSKTNIWKVSIDGGSPIQLSDENSTRPTWSPDGKFVACAYGEASRESSRSVALIPFDGGPPARTLDLPKVIASNIFRWTADGRGLIYIDSRDRVYNLWSQSLDSSPPKQLTDFSSDEIFKFDWSRDGKKLALARGHEGSDVVLISNFNQH